MTPQSIFIAFIAGITSMVLLAAGLSGASLALPLMILAPLPIAIAGLGWGSFIGFLAVGFTFVGLTLVNSFASGLFFAALLGAPIAYMVHLAGLSRQDDPNQPEEWFPESIIFWRTILIGGGAVGLAFIISGFNVEEVTKLGLAHFTPSLQQLDETSRKTMEEAIALQIRLSPYSMPTIWLLAMWLNLSLGIKIAKISERFNRPEFFLKKAELPQLVIPVFAGAVLLSFINPPLAYLGAALVGIIIMAIIMLGFNTLHVVTAHWAMRGFLLTLLYMATLFLSFPLVIVLFIGLADHFFKIRQRYGLANTH